MSERLKAIAKLVRTGASVVDVGCDHALLPVLLAREGRCGAITACELNPLPLEKARAAVRAAGLEGRINVLRSDGLEAVLPEEADDIVIAGMGGELIASILAAAKPFHAPSKRFILQPMSKADELRRWLCENGFEITHETLVKENRRLFVIIYAQFTGIKHSLTDEEYLIGQYILLRRPPHADEHISRWRRVREKQLAAKIKINLKSD